MSRKENPLGTNPREIVDSQADWMLFAFDIDGAFAAKLVKLLQEQFAVIDHNTIKLIQPSSSQSGSIFIHSSAFFPDGGQQKEKEVTQMWEFCDLLARVMMPDPEDTVGIGNGHGLLRHRYKQACDAMANRLAILGQSRVVLSVYQQLHLEPPYLVVREATGHDLPMGVKHAKTTNFEGDNDGTPVTDSSEVQSTASSELGECWEGVGSPDQGV